MAERRQLARGTNVASSHVHVHVRRGSAALSALAPPRLSRRAARTHCLRQVQVVELQQHWRINSIDSHRIPSLGLFKVQARAALAVELGPRLEP